ncbi:hypothetical protein J7L05_00560 [bacterium]|nr:hypothetical protein [bacterium]
MEKRKDILATAILLLVIIIRFAPFIFSGTPINTDSWKSYYPWAADFSSSEIKTINYDSNMEYGTWFPMVKKEISEGRFPHWNQYSGCGMPWYADHLIPVFHLPFAIALLFPGDLVFAGYIFLMSIIGTLFFYWFMRNWNFSVFVSLFGGLAFFLSGWQMYLYPPEVASLIWIAPILLFYDRFLKSNRMSDACWAAFFIGQLLIGGYPVMIVHFFYFIAAYVAWRYFYRNFNWNVPVKRWVFAVLMMAIIGVLISAVQNYPTYKFMQLTNRSVSSEQKMFQSPDEIIEQKKQMLQTDEFMGTADRSIVNVIMNLIRKKTTIIIPNFNIDFNESRTFAGPVIVFLALLGLFAAHRRFNLIKIFFVIFGIFFLVGPIFLLVARFIPGWSISALNPREVFFFLLFFMAVLGLDFLEKLKGKNRLVGIFSLVMAILSGLLCLLHPSILKLENANYHWNISQDAISLIVFMVISILVLILIAARTFSCRLKSVHISAGLTAFIIAGILAHCYLYSYFADKQYMPDDSNMKKITAIANDGRFARYSTEQPRLSFKEKLEYILPPNTPSRFEMMDALGYDNMMLANMEEFMIEAAPGSVLRSRGTFHILGAESLNPNGLFIQSTGTRYIMEKQSEAIPFSNGNTVYDESDIRIYDLHTSELAGSPYMKAVTEFEFVDGYQDNSYTDNFRNKVILDKPPVILNRPGLESSEKNNASLTVLSFERNSTAYRTDFEVSNDCVLFIADTFHPRWRAKLDGEEVEILQANYAFRAIAVPKGNHELFMWYDGIEVRAGGVVSAISLLICILIGLIDRKKDNRGR